jgi:hypothetical protein
MHLGSCRALLVVTRLGFVYPQSLNTVNVDLLNDVLCWLRLHHAMCGASSPAAEHNHISKVARVGRAGSPMVWGPQRAHRLRRLRRPRHCTLARQPRRPRHL